MKKIIFILLASLLLTSCNKTADDVRKIKVGISTNDLKYVMGEPYLIEVQNGYEIWHFHYDSNSGFLSPTNRFNVTIKDDKVTNFETF